MVNKYKIAREVIEEYTKEFLNGDTMLHIQEWTEEKALELDKPKNKKVSKKSLNNTFKDLIIKNKQVYGKAKKG